MTEIEDYSIIPRDELYDIRARRLNNAIDIYRKFNHNKLVGLVYLNRRYLFLKDITWITHKDYRNKGIATELVKSALQNYNFVVAKTRNKASRRIAEKVGFIEMFKNYWIWLGNKRNILFITRP